MERSNTHSGNKDGLPLRSEPRSAATTPSDFVLQWGNRKRLRCMKFQSKDISNSSGSGRVDRRAVRSDLRDPNSTLKNCSAADGYLNLRQRPPSPSRRILRNSDGMRSVHSNGAKSGTSGNSNSTHHHLKNNDQQQHGGGGGSDGGDTVAAVWPPKFAIALTNKEKEEDFLAIKGSKLPHRPKKRAKFIQRTLNLVSPGGWLCDLTLERYEVREKKVSKKRPRGLKAMGNMESDSE